MTYKIVTNRLNSTIWQSKKWHFQTQVALFKDITEFGKCICHSRIEGKKESEELPNNVQLNHINNYFAEMRSFHKRAHKN